MKACSRCGTWHTTAEEGSGRYMSCTEVKQYWSKMRQMHSQETGHLAMIKIGKDGTITCIKCGQTIDRVP